MVPATPKLIASPFAALASAARSVPAPLSAVLVTVIVFALAVCTASSATRRTALCSFVGFLSELREQNSSVHSKALARVYSLEAAKNAPIVKKNHVRRMAKGVATLDAVEESRQIAHTERTITE
jgi:hypothetical protein